MAVVRHAARELTGADGATFVLRDADKCFYADENAIAPLWKGQRFPMSTCISGWAMLNRQVAVIEDIYADPRIPQDAYRPTFVKSLVMVPFGPIRHWSHREIWANRHLASPHEIEILQALANTTAVALEDVALYSELERRVKERTLQLEQTDQELEAFSYSVSHDLRAPLRHMNGFAGALVEVWSSLDETAQNYISRINAGAAGMARLIDDLLRLARFTRAEMKNERLYLTPSPARSRQNCAEQIRAGMPSSESKMVSRFPAIKGCCRPSWKTFYPTPGNIPPRRSRPSLSLKSSRTRRPGLFRQGQWRGF